MWKLPKSDAPVPVVRDVVTATLEAFPELTREQLVSPSTARRFAWPRQMAMAAAFEMTAASSTQIGNFFNRDHSCVLNAVARVRARVSADEDVEFVQKRIRERAAELARTAAPFRDRTYIRASVESGVTVQSLMEAEQQKEQAA